MLIQVDLSANSIGKNQSQPVAAAPAKAAAEAVEEVKVDESKLRRVSVSTNELLFTQGGQD